MNSTQNDVTSTLSMAKRSDANKTIEGSEPQFQASKFE